MTGTMSEKKKPKSKESEPSSAGAGKYKPYRAYRVPMALAELITELTEEEIGTDETEHVRTAIREYLQRKGKLKKPGAES